MENTCYMILKYNTLAEADKTSQQYLDIYKYME